jgi:16S rRNA (guanine527-N7)-methyltransferase
VTPESIADLLQPYVAAPGAQDPGPDWPRIHSQLAVYLALIQKWNTRVNLTAIRTAEEIVRRHFGESLFAAARIGSCNTLLDFGSGAGFPGVPIQLLRPDIQVTLAESRHKKVAFLREVVRTLGLETEIWADRVEAIPSSRRFDVIALRAVDNMDSAVREAALRTSERLLILGTRSSAYPGLAGQFDVADQIPLPESTDGTLLILRRR